MFHLVSYWLVLGEPKVYQNLGNFTRIGEFTWRGNLQGRKRKEVTKLPCKYYINIFYQLRITQYPTSE